LRIQFDVELSKPLKYFLQTRQEVFKASSVHRDIIYLHENTDVQPILKDLHHTCLKSMSTVSASLDQPCWCKHTKFRQERVYLLAFLCQNPLKASRLENQAAFSTCWKFTFRIGRNPATGWTWKFAYLQSTVILNSSRFPGLGTIRTGEDHRLLGFSRRTHSSPASLRA